MDIKEKIKKTKERILTLKNNRGFACNAAETIDFHERMESQEQHLEILEELQKIQEAQKEKVCKWRHTFDGKIDTGCGMKVFDFSVLSPYCEYCGGKIEVVK